MPGAASIGVKEFKGNFYLFMPVLGVIPGRAAASVRRLRFQVCQVRACRPFDLLPVSLFVSASIALREAPRASARP